MKLNQNTKLVGDQAVLVPYCVHHVPKYHDWMQSPELLELTASERLPLEKEYEMQQSWLQDEDKCTFIILDADKLDSCCSEIGEIDAMAGDVNLFLNDPDDHQVAEIEIMIAEPSSRRKGIGEEALVMMMQYANESLGVIKFVAKIGQNNVASQALFHKVNFKQVSVTKVFSEAVLELLITDDNRHWLADRTKHVHTEQYKAS